MLKRNIIFLASKASIFSPFVSSTSPVENAVCKVRLCLLKTQDMTKILYFPKEAREWAVFCLHDNF